MADPRGLDPAVRTFLDGVSHRVRRRDAETLLALMESVTGERAALWGPSIVAFGSYHYKYESGREGDAPAAGFSPRKAASVVYLSDGVGAHADLVDRLGPHTSGVGCLYIKDLTQVDLGVLEQLVARSYAALTAGTHGLRAREGGAGS
ncbi:DUF1801 domain-containing protein [Rhodococcus sp. NPDC003348]